MGSPSVEDMSYLESEQKGKEIVNFQISKRSPGLSTKNLCYM